ncbi:uncharacterized protein YcbK (DUF882 family) [Hoeflea marina]|uniref:Murein endopeptidase K n=1 Tax=Hoeflea marina TaxID=274592 RepID=A0A317PF76_9HYPH|nr:DUF882 domain-containing protein [Hoeflea marina]PWV97236.1 uncharacterized protein YcbK (DUF882 family) [Hoeflea marina]
MRAGLLVMLLLAGLTTIGTVTVGSAMAETRSLKLYYLHTKEKAEIVYKRNGRYDQAGLQKLNRFLRDWRRNEPTKMDPRLFDLLWETYRQSGARGYINVVSAYRSPATNDMLRRTRGGQAKKSQHMLGKAMDFYIPGVKLSRIREIGMKLQGGGVGYYPKSGSPFVHLDVGGVRAWPRMSRDELVRLFPNGKTMHLPPDGKPLPGYQVAVADYKRRNGAVASVASSADSGSDKKSGGLLAALFGGGDEDEVADTGESAPTPTRAPVPPAEVEVAALPGVPAGDGVTEAQSVGGVVVLPSTAPIPLSRPATEPQIRAAALVAPIPQVPAQAEIDAFASAAAAAATVPPATATIRDLSEIQAPIPLLLAERAAKPQVEPAASVPETEIAALAAPATGVTALAALPVPAEAPEPGSASATIAALASMESFVPLPIRRPGDAQVPAAEPALAVAALAPQPDSPVASAFDASVAVAHKGDRPSARDASAGRRASVRIAPKLTETIISRWALARDTAAPLAATSAHGQRFVASQLRAAPEEVYAAGFAPNAGDLPHAAFTGPAVNFVTMAKFSTGG